MTEVDDLLHRPVVRQPSAQPGAVVELEEGARHDEAQAPAGSQQGHPALDERHVGVEGTERCGVPLTAVLGNVPSERLDADVWGIADDSIESAAVPDASVLLEKSLRELQLPVEGPPGARPDRRRDRGVALAQQRLSQLIQVAGDPLLLVRLLTRARVDGRDGCHSVEHPLGPLGKLVGEEVGAAVQQRS